MGHFPGFIHFSNESEELDNLTENLSGPSFELLQDVVTMAKLAV